MEFDDLGCITSIYDRQADRELAAGLCNDFRMYRDVPSRFDAWDIDSMYAQTPVALSGTGRDRGGRIGPSGRALRVRRKLHNSHMTQEISSRRGAGGWTSSPRSIGRSGTSCSRSAFAVDYHANDAVHEIQFGHIRRPNHHSRPFDADRFEVCSHKWSALAEEGRGFAVLNDCKYGLNVLGKSINLTLLRSPWRRTCTADRGLQEFTYSFYAWNGSLLDSGVVREAYELNAGLLQVAGAAGQRSVFAVDAPNVVIEAVKPAEDASGDMIVRVYEAKRTATRCTLRTTLPVGSVQQADMLERPTGPVACEGGQIDLDLRPFEIRTLRLSF